MHQFQIKCFTFYSTFRVIFKTLIPSAYPKTRKQFYWRVFCDYSISSSPYAFGCGVMRHIVIKRHLMLFELSLKKNTTHANSNLSRMFTSIVNILKQFKLSYLFKCLNHTNLKITISYFNFPSIEN